MSENRKDNLMSNERKEMIRKQKAMREHVFRLLFVMDFRDKEETEEQLDLYLDTEFPKDGEEPYDETYVALIRRKFLGVRENMEEIDALLNSVSKGWKVERMGKADLNIMRLAVYEMKYDTDKVAVPIIINDAVELAKNYGQEASYSFVNGILGKVSRLKETPEENQKEEEN